MEIPGIAKSSTKKRRRRPTDEDPLLPAVGKMHLRTRPEPHSIDRKSASKRVKGLKGPPTWNSRRHGLLFDKDVEEARKLQREDPYAFKSSARAQAIVDYAEQSLEWQVGLTRAAAACIPQPFRDLWIARNRKLKPKERLEALDRFAQAFSKIPMNVAMALFAWLDGGPVNHLIAILNRLTFALGVDPKTGELREMDGRGRKRSAATGEKLVFAAQLSNQGISQYKMATKLFPGLPHEKAYARTRDFFLKNRYAIERAKYRLRHQSPSSSKSPA